MRTWTIAFSAALAIAALPKPAAACGAAYPGGPVMCEFPRKGAPGSKRPRARLSLNWAYTQTTLLFGEGRRADLTRHAVLGAVEMPLGPKLSLQFGAGGIAGGALTHGLSRDAIGPGWSGFFGVAGRLIEGRGAAPFVQLTGAVSTTHMLTRSGSEAPRYTAFDARVGAMVGKTLGDVVTPYAVGRVFGGPIFWRFEGADVTGTDLYKYQVGGGLALTLPGRVLDAFVEGVAFGERGVSAGLGTTFF